MRIFARIIVLIAVVALIVAAENVPGVKQVNDHVAWIEPMSGMILEPQSETTGLPKAS